MKEEDREKFVWILLFTDFFSPSFSFQSIIIHVERY